jgi:hydroxymethylpyrimidine pyrophosphatase-like HAD family hydrolase
MHFRALATDYDGTLATHGFVDHETIASLERFIESGRLLIMVTGRELHDLKRVFQRTDLFSLVVAENGALVYDPATGEQELLCVPIAAEFAEELRRRGVPVSVGQAIVATVQPHEETARSVIRDMGLPLEISLNKGSIMVLPEGVSKVTGLRRAAVKLGLSEASVVGIGDAENDLDFIAACGCGVAVANATPQVKSRADLVTDGAHGSGVAEVIDQLLADGRLGCERSRLVPE